MSNETTAVAVTTNELADRPVLDLRSINLATLDPQDPRLVPTNKQISDYFADGYVLSEFRTRSRDAAKDEAKRIRLEEGKRTAYITLLGGWFSVLIADPKETEADIRDAYKAARPSVPVAVQFPNGETFQFDSTKAARAFARLIIEAARQAEWEADVAAVEAAKAAQAAPTEG